MSSGLTSGTGDSRTITDWTREGVVTGQQWPVKTSHRSLQKPPLRHLKSEQGSQGSLAGSKVASGRSRTDALVMMPNSLQDSTATTNQPVRAQSIPRIKFSDKMSQVIVQQGAPRSSPDSPGCFPISGAQLVGDPTTMFSEKQMPSVSYPVQVTSRHRSLPDIRRTCRTTRKQRTQDLVHDHGLKSYQKDKKPEMGCLRSNSQDLTKRICVETTTSRTWNFHPIKRTVSSLFRMSQLEFEIRTHMMPRCQSKGNDSGSTLETGPELNSVAPASPQPSRPILTRLPTLNVMSKKPHQKSPSPTPQHLVQLQTAPSTHCPPERLLETNAAMTSHLADTADTDFIVSRVVIEKDKNQGTYITNLSLANPCTQVTNMLEELQTVSPAAASITPRYASMHPQIHGPALARPQAIPIARVDTADHTQGIAFRQEPCEARKDHSRVLDSSATFTNHTREQSRHQEWEDWSTSTTLDGQEPTLDGQGRHKSHHMYRARSSSIAHIAATATRDRVMQAADSLAIVPTIPITPVTSHIDGIIPREGGSQRSFHRKSYTEKLLATPSADRTATDASPVSTDDDAADWKEAFDYDTPCTSPTSSPTKDPSDPYLTHLKTSAIHQLDGANDDIVSDLSARDIPINEHEKSRATDNIRRTLRLPIRFARAAHSSREWSLVPDLPTHPCATGSPTEEETPLVPPSEAEHYFAHHHTSLNNADRPSSIELPFRTSRTPRRISSQVPAYRTPDRFVPGRASTPTKEGLNVQGLQESLSSNNHRSWQDDDPFGPVSRLGLRSMDRFLPTRSPATPLRSTSAAATRANGQYLAQRRGSGGTVWSVGGLLVTEGVTSTTDGRGGRVTSGTNATHHVAGFVRRFTPTQSTAQHGRRLALAMDIDASGRMIKNHSSFRALLHSLQPPSRAWRDGSWQPTSQALLGKQPPKSVKDIPIIPFRVLDAPALRDDFYCSLLAYSPTLSCLAVGLGSHVYLWLEAKTTTATAIPDSLTSNHSSHVTSLAFSSAEGGKAILAVGRADGRITLWSPLDGEPRFDSEQPSAISCVSFRPLQMRRPSVRDPAVSVLTEQLLVGDESGHVYYYSIEWPDQDQRDLFDWHGSMTLLSRIECHAQQVCGICWSPTGDFFASGGNDNQLFLFEVKKMLRTSGTQSGCGTSVTVRSKTAAGKSTRAEVISGNAGQATRVFHLNAAVKAIAFAPWQPSLLAAGGGSNDRCIHFFHTQSGASLATIDCHAQVTSLVWSEKKKEIAATFGFAQPDHPYRIAVFNWPSCAMVVAIPWWGEERALFAIGYPRGPAGNATTGQSDRTDSEGRAWYGRRTREEGCLVVATSDASIKFHEIWAEPRNHREKHRGAATSRILRGSQILEGECSEEIERMAVIR